MRNFIKIWYNTTKEIAATMYGKKFAWIGLVSWLLGFVGTAIIIAVWIKCGFIAALKFYGLTCLAFSWLFVLTIARMCIMRAHSDNHVVNNFNKWFKKKNDVVVIVGAKWADPEHQNLITHTFKSYKDDVEELNLNKLMLIEILENYYDDTHGTEDTEARSDAFETITNNVDEILDKIASLD